MADPRKLAALEELEQAGKLDTETLLAVATDPDHPCHDEFDWDDTSAAHQFRLGQAGRMIVRYRVTIEDGDREVPVRRYTHVGSEARWVDGDRAAVDHREELIATAERDARRLVLKHRRLGDDTLAKVFKQALKT